MHFAKLNILNIYFKLNINIKYFAKLKLNKKKIRKFSFNFLKTLLKENKV